MERQIEILAPAGSYEGMKAAMNAGCDAVYIGGSSFGARAYANNLEEEILLRAIDEAHIRDKRLYLTVNTLLKEKELTEKLYAFLEKFYLQGLDAVIVQDVGVMHFIHKHFPRLPIHASTQMTLTMAQGANLLKNSGVTRIVTSRELSLKEIKTIRENSQLEIETFVHGALCYCYSGQCLMSSMIGGRSGNRGRCAQPCRMPYQFHSGGKKLSTEQEKYLLSPKDINTLSIIPDLVEAGIDSFKIEGRMKRPEYAAAVSSLYRKYVDLYFTLGKEKYNKILSNREFEEDIIKLQDIYNRGGFSEGYGKTYNGKKMMSLYRPNHSGVYVGKVTDRKGSQVSIKLEENVNAQDILEIRMQEEEGYEFTVKDGHRAGEVLFTNVGRRPEPAERQDKSGGIDNRRFQEPMIRVGASVFRTKNNALLESLSNEYTQKDRRLGIRGLLKAKLGERLSLTVTYHDIEACASQDLVQEAMKQPMTKEKLTAPIEKTGDTLFFFEELSVEADDNIFVPVAWLNEVRRNAIEALQMKIAEKYRRSNDQMEGDKGKTDFYPDVFEKDMEVSNEQGKDKKGIVVSVQTVEQLECSLQFPEITSIYADFERVDKNDIPDMVRKVKKAGKNIYLALPHICRLAEYDRLKKELNEIIENEAITGFLVKNLEEIALLESLEALGKPKKEIILNYNMYVYNMEAKNFWKDKGISHFTAPVELNYQELKQLGIEDCDMIIYGYLPLMVSAQCLFESTGGCIRCKENNSGYLTDRLGKKFFVQTNCRGCYNIIYNGQPLALHKQEEEIKGLNPYRLRMDFSTETTEQMEQVIGAFIDTYLYGRKNESGLCEYTTGHFKRGVE
jgi:U32 family peptidase